MLSFGENSALLIMYHLVYSLQNQCSKVKYKDKPIYDCLVQASSELCYHELNYDLWKCYLAYKQASRISS